MKTMVRTVVGGAFLTLLSLSACKKKDKDHDHDSGGQTPGSRWVEIGHAHSQGDRYHGDLYVELPAERDSIQEGYHRFRVRIRQGSHTGSLYAGTDVRLWPMMYMSNHTHSCPVEQITSGPNSEGFYEGAAFFLMPTTVVNGQVTEPWKMHVLVGQSDTLTFDIFVKPHSSRWVRRKVFANDLRLLYEMRPTQLAVGSQDVTFWVYERDMNVPMTDPASFPATTDLRLHLKTWMPSMGHGAEGTQDAQPVSGKPGWYAGKLGFNMTGDWEVYVTFIRNTDTLGRDTFQLRF